MYLLRQYVSGCSLQHTATRCNTLQHTATHCNSQYVSVHSLWIDTSIYICQKLLKLVHVCTCLHVYACQCACLNIDTDAWVCFGQFSFFFIYSSLPQDYSWPSTSEVVEGDEWQRKGDCGMFGANC